MEIATEQGEICDVRVEKNTSPTTFLNSIESRKYCRQYMTVLNNFRPDATLLKGEDSKSLEVLAGVVQRTAAYLIF